MATIIGLQYIAIKNTKKNIVFIGLPFHFLLINLLT